MKNRKNRIWITLALAVSSILIGFLGELMPDSFKLMVENWATQTLGISYLEIWIGATVSIVLLFLLIVWKDALKNDSLRESPDISELKVVQHGKKSVVIKESHGDINIS